MADSESNGDSKGIFLSVFLPPTLASNSLSKESPHKQDPSVPPRHKVPRGERQKELHLRGLLTQPASLAGLEPARAAPRPVLFLLLPARSLNGVCGIPRHLWGRRSSLDLSSAQLIGHTQDAPSLRRGSRDVLGETAYWLVPRGRQLWAAPSTQWIVYGLIMGLGRLGLHQWCCFRSHGNLSMV